MGKFKNGILGAFSGRIGTVVGYELNGVAVGRSLPKTRTGKVSTAELANRKKFADLQYWLQPLTKFLRIGFKDYNPGFQGFTAAKSYNFKHAVTGSCPDFVIDPALALVSFGKLAQSGSAAAASLAPHTLNLSWTDEEYYSMEKAMVLVYDIGRKLAVMDTAAAWRAAGRFNWELGQSFSGQQVHVYLAFVAIDQSERSNSQYLGAVTLL